MPVIDSLKRYNFIPNRPRFSANYCFHPSLPLYRMGYSSTGMSLPNEYKLKHALFMFSNTIQTLCSWGCVWVRYRILQYCKEVDFSVFVNTFVKTCASEKPEYKIFQLNTSTSSHLVSLPYIPCSMLIVENMISLKVTSCQTFDVVLDDCCTACLIVWATIKFSNESWKNNRKYSKI